MLPIPPVDRSLVVLDAYVYVMQRRRNVLSYVGEAWDYSRPLHSTGYVDFFPNELGMRLRAQP
jgi:hypothetical protein